MKVKNIAFSGFAAAILMGVCGAAQAAEPLKIASQAYVVKQVGMKQDKLTAANAGDGIKLNMDDNGNLTDIAVDWDKVASNDSVTEKIGDAITEGEQFKEAVDDAIKDAVEGGVVGETIDSKIGAVDAEGNQVELTTDAKNTYGAINELQTEVNAAQGAAEAAQEAADAAQEAADAAQGAADAAQAKADSAYILADAAQTADEVAGAIDAKINELDLANTYAGKAATEQGIREAKDAAAAAQAASTADGKAVAAQGAADSAAQAASKAQGEVDALELVVADKADSSTVSGLADTVAANKKAVEDANYMSGNNINAGSYLMLSDGKGGITWSSIAIVDENGDVLTLSSDAPTTDTNEPEVGA